MRRAVDALIVAASSVTAVCGEFHRAVHCHAKACDGSASDGARSHVACHRSYAPGRNARLGQDGELFRCAEVDRPQRGSGGEEDKEGTARKSIVGVGESW